MSHWIRPWPLLVGAVILSGFNAPIASSQEPEGSIEAVGKAWEARREAIRTARFVWKEKCFYPEGSNILALMPRPGVKTGRYPVSDITFIQNGDLLIDNISIRLVADGMIWNLEKAEFFRDRSTVVFDGTSETKLIEPSVLSWHQANMRTTKWCQELRSANVMPFMLALRPGHPTWGYILLSDYEWTGRKLNIQGELCSELSHSDVRRGSLSTVWVNPKQGYTITRLEKSTKGIVSLRVDIRYSTYQSSLYIPKSWDVQFNNDDGSLSVSYSGSATETQINIATKPSDFEIDLPIGTRVLDRRDGKKLDYIVRDDGTTRVILPHEFGASYQEMLSTPSGQARGGRGTPPTQWTNRWILAAIAGVTVGILVVVALGIRRVFVRRRTTQSVLAIGHPPSK